MIGKWSLWAGLHLALVTLLGCSESSSPVRMASGLVMQDLRIGHGPVPDPGRWVVVHYEGRLESGEPVDSSYARGRPDCFEFGVGQLLAGWDEGLATLRVGGMRRLTIPPKLAYGDTGKGERIPPGSTLVYELELLELFERTPSGLQVRVLEEGEGNPGQPGQTAVLEYRGTMPPSGREFDSSKRRGRPFEFILGSGIVIDGLEEAVAAMRPGGRSEVVVPPHLGYGEAGIGILVPPGSDLLYEIHLIGVR